MILIRRRAAETAMSSNTRSALAKRQANANALSPGDAKISKLWANFLNSKPKTDVAKALDQCFRFKCAYCEGVAAQDIEHFHPKTQFPKRMFDWYNFLRGCKNCNNFKLDRFPLTATGGAILLDPCGDEPLDYFVWDLQTGAMSARPEVGYRERAEATRDLFRLNMEPLREERRNKLALILYFLAQVVNEVPVTQPTKDRLRDELDPCRPWLGIVRQLFHRPGAKFVKLVEAARAKLPEIDQWIAPWF